MWENQYDSHQQEGKLQNCCGGSLYLQQMHVCKKHNSFPEWVAQVLGSDVWYHAWGNTCDQQGPGESYQRCSIILGQKHMCEEVV